MSKQILLAWIKFNPPYFPNGPKMIILLLSVGRVSGGGKLRDPTEYV
jgi:hypothetical protein